MSIKHIYKKLYSTSVHDEIEENILKILVEKAYEILSEEMPFSEAAMAVLKEKYGEPACK